MRDLIGKGVRRDWVKLVFRRRLRDGGGGGDSLFCVQMMLERLFLCIFILQEAHIKPPEDWAVAL